MQGYVKDLRVRWALEEAGLPYQVRLVAGRSDTADPYRKWQPFGQVPAYRDDEVELFESGAIVLHLAACSGMLAPADVAGRARVTAWVLAALNSIEPHAQNVIQFDSALPGAAERLAPLQAVLDRRLIALTAWLEGRNYLEDGFSAEDLMMAMVLREVQDDGGLGGFPALDAYCRRCLGRPAFGRALDAQMQVFAAHTPS